MADEKKVDVVAGKQDVVVSGTPVGDGKTDVEKSQEAKAAKALKAAQAAIDDANENQPEMTRKGAAEALKISQEPADELPEAALDPTLTPFEVGGGRDYSLEPKIPYVEHPKSVRGYDVLDLTSPYNHAHSEAPVAGFFRVSKHSAPEIHQDVVTDGPFYRYGHESRLTPTSERLINAAVDVLEKRRKEDQ